MPVFKSLLIRLAYRRFVWALAAAVIALAASKTPAQATPGDVLTQKNDTARTGAQLSESILTPANVKAGTFGRLYTRRVNGQIIAQPLYVSQLAIPGLGTKNVVFVVTRANTVYAFDADSADTDPTHGLIWNAPVTVEPAAYVPNMCSETVSPIGVTSTPVIDRTTNTMYLVARKADGTIWLHSLDITTGAPIKAVQITASYNGLTFNQGLELQRAGLLLQNGVVVLAFSALNCDNAGWHGWVIAYRSTDLAQVGVFATTSAAGWGGGVWQSGTGLVGDGAGNIFFTTGNGSVNGNTDLGESFVKLAIGPAPTYGLTYQAKYTVSNWLELNNGDTDLGAGGPLLLPGNRIVGGGKQGKLYVLNTTNLQPAQNPATPGPVPAGGSDGFQAFVNSWHDDATLPTCMIAPLLLTACYKPHAGYGAIESAGPNIHAGLVYWNGSVYGMPEKDYLRAFSYNSAAGTLSTTSRAVSTVRSPDGMPGSALSISANGSTNGIIWAQVPKFDGQWQNVPGALVAFDAVTLQELWRDDDDIGFAKFTPVTVAGGKVFRPTFANELIVYGLNGSNTQSCYTIPELYQNYSSENGLLGIPDNIPVTLPDGVGSAQTFVGNTAAIFWSPITCAHEMHGAIYAKYKAATFLGYPLTDEINNVDGVGVHNDFAHGSTYADGSIYWSPLTGAFEVHGAIRLYWVTHGGAWGPFGYPVSDETDQIDGSGRFSLFEHGAIYWSNTTGAITTILNPGKLTGPQQANAGMSGQDFAAFFLPQANPTLCQERCAFYSQCVAWNYIAPNSVLKAPSCFLKTGVPLATPNSFCVSGLQIPIQPSNMSSINGSQDEPGGDFAQFNLVSPDPRLCQAECSYNATCRAWSYVTPNSIDGPTPICSLKSSQPASVVNAYRSSGKKIQ